MLNQDTEKKQLFWDFAHALLWNINPQFFQAALRDNSQAKLFLGPVVGSRKKTNGKITERLRLDQSRKEWAGLKKLASLTVPQFKCYLKNSLEGLPVSEEEGTLSYFRLLRSFPPPTDASFWQQLDEIDTLSDKHKDRPLDYPIDRMLYGAFHLTNPEWIVPGESVLLLLRDLRANANIAMDHFQARYDPKNPNAVAKFLEITRDPTAPLVRDALEKKGDLPPDQEQTLVKLFTDALKKTGKGRVSRYTTQQRKKQKAEEAAISKAVSRWTKRYKKNLKFSGNQTEAYRQTVGDFKDSKHIKDPRLKRSILRKFKQRINQEKGN